MIIFLTESQTEALLIHVDAPWLVVLSFLIGTCGSALGLYAANSAAKKPVTSAQEPSCWHRADDALYRAKDNGRNRVEVFQEAVY